MNIIQLLLSGGQYPSTDYVNLMELLGLGEPEQVMFLLLCLWSGLQRTTGGLWILPKL